MTSMELYSRDKREKLGSLSFLLVEPPFNLSPIPVPLCHTETKSLKGQVLPHAVTPLGIDKTEMISTTCPGSYLPYFIKYKMLSSYEVMS